MDKLFLSKKQMYIRLKTISTSNLKKYGRSLSEVSLFNYFNDCIICVHNDLNGVLFEIDQIKYKKIREHVKSKEFNCDK